MVGRRRRHRRGSEAGSAWSAPRDPARAVYTRQNRCTAALLTPRPPFRRLEVFFPTTGFYTRRMCIHINRYIILVYIYIIYVHIMRRVYIRAMSTPRVYRYTRYTDTLYINNSHYRNGTTRDVLE